MKMFEKVKIEIGRRNLWTSLSLMTPLYSGILVHTGRKGNKMLIEGRKVSFRKLGEQVST